MSLRLKSRVVAPRQSTKLQIIQLEDRTVPAGLNGDAVIQSPGDVNGGGPIVVHTGDWVAGAVDSIQWGGREFVNNYDHGRQAQSALWGITKAMADGGNYNKVEYNPTEAGSNADGLGPNPSTSYLHAKATPQGNRLTTKTQMAFWGAGPGVPNPVGVGLSQYYVRKDVTIGAFGLNNVIRHRVTFTVPVSDQLVEIQTYPLIIYAPADFKYRYEYKPDARGQTTYNAVWDPNLQQYVEQEGAIANPAILMTDNGTHAIAMFTRPSSRWPGGYNVNASVYRPNGVPTGGGPLDNQFSEIHSSYNWAESTGKRIRGAFTFDSYVVVGNGTQVEGTLNELRDMGLMGDMSGKRAEDILWHDPGNGVNEIWSMKDAAGSFASDAWYRQKYGIDGSYGWTTPTAGDFNGDGVDDLLFHNTGNGQNVIWYLRDPLLPGAPDLNKPWFQSMYTIGSTAGTGETIHAGDFNGDGVDDLLFHNTSTGANGIWYLKAPSGGSWNLGQYPIGSSGNETIHVGDYNGDGVDDLLFHNTSTGANGIWYLREYAGGNWAIWQFGIDSSGAGTTAVTGDFNGDGTDDLLYHNISSGANTIWYLQDHKGIPASWKLDELDLTATGGESIYAGDFNGDGTDDLLFHNTSSGWNGVWYLRDKAIGYWAIQQFPIDYELGIPVV